MIGGEYVVEFTLRGIKHQHIQKNTIINFNHKRREMENATAMNAETKNTPMNEIIGIGRELNADLNSINSRIFNLCERLGCVEPSPDSKGADLATNPENVLGKLRDINTEKSNTQSMIRDRLAWLEGAL